MPAIPTTNGGHSLPEVVLSKGIIEHFHVPVAVNIDKSRTDHMICGVDCPFRGCIRDITDPRNTIIYDSHIPIVPCTTCTVHDTAIYDQQIKLLCPDVRCIHCTS
ncbi:hypothetical protein ACFL1G_07670 [Planctomycetota bacterium]